MKEDKLLIEFGNFLLKDREVNEDDLKLFEEHLKAKCEKKFRIMDKKVDDKTKYGVFIFLESEFRSETFMPHFFDEPLHFVREVNRLIEEGYKLV